MSTMSDLQTSSASEALSAALPQQQLQQKVQQKQQQSSAAVSLAEAIAAKEEGNCAFRKKGYVAAVAAYTRCLDLLNKLTAAAEKRNEAEVVEQSEKMGAKKSPLTTEPRSSIEAAAVSVEQVTAGGAAGAANVADELRELTRTELHESFEIAEIAKKTVDQIVLTTSSASSRSTITPSIGASGTVSTGDGAASASFSTTSAVNDAKLTSPEISVFGSKIHSGAADFDLASSVSELKATALTNRALCHLRCCDFEQAERDTTAALIEQPANVKALFRRACALEKQQKLAESVKDLQRCLWLQRDNKEVAEMLSRLRDQAFQVQQRQQELLSPACLLEQALTCTQQGEAEQKSVAERAEALRTLTGMLQDQVLQAQFIRGGGLVRVATFLAYKNASRAAGSMNEETQSAATTATASSSVTPEEGVRPAAAPTAEASQTPTTTEIATEPTESTGVRFSSKDNAEQPAAELEALCWRVLLTLVQQPSLPVEDSSSTTKISNASKDSSSKKSSPPMTSNEAVEAPLQLLPSVLASREKLRSLWGSNQLLLRLRQLLQAGVSSRFVCSSQSSPEQRSCESREDGCKTMKQQGALTLNRSDAFWRAEACCNLLLVMGALEQLKADTFEDDCAFCEACALSMQCSDSLEIQAAGVAALAAVADARRRASVQKSTALALRHGIEKVLEIVLQLLVEVEQQHQQWQQLQQQQQVHEQSTCLSRDMTAASVENGEKDVRQQQKQKCLSSAFSIRSKPVSGGAAGAAASLLLGDGAFLRQNARAAADAARAAACQQLDRQIELLLVTIFSLFVDKRRAAPPIQAAAKAVAQTSKSKTPLSADADVMCLLERLLEPYLFRGCCLFDRSSNSSTRSSSRHYNSNGSQVSDRASSCDGGVNPWIVVSRISNKEDAEEVGIGQIVGWKVLRLLLTAAREETRAFLAANSAVVSFMLAVAADEENAREPHMSEQLWLHQQAAALELLLLCMDFPELRQQLLLLNGATKLAEAAAAVAAALAPATTTSKKKDRKKTVVVDNMRWQLSAALAAATARLAVHAADVRIQLFDTIDFYELLQLLVLHHSSQNDQEGRKFQLEQQPKKTSEFPLLPGGGSSSSSNSNSSSTNNFTEKSSSNAGLWDEMVAAMPSNNNSSSSFEMQRAGETPAATVEENTGVRRLFEIFFFLSLHKEFKQRLVDEEKSGSSFLCNMLGLLERSRSSSSNTFGSNSRNMNVSKYLALQSLANLMLSREDRRRRKRKGRAGDAGAVDQLDEEQHQQLEAFFEQLPAEAKPVPNGEIDMGEKQVAVALQDCLLRCGVVRHLVAALLQPQQRDKQQQAQGKLADLAYDEQQQQQQQLTQVLLPSRNVLGAAAEMMKQLTSVVERRGQIVKEGGLQLLLFLVKALESGGSEWEEEQRFARQAAAQLCISVNPLLFSYREALDTIPCLVHLLKDSHELLQYEGALALTNLTSINDDARLCAWHAGAWHHLENLLFGDNQLLRAAALEGWCNLTAAAAVQEAFGNRCEQLAEQKQHEQRKQQPCEALKTQKAPVKAAKLHTLSILLAFSVDVENPRAQQAAVAALAMLLQDSRTADAVAADADAFRLLSCLEQAASQCHADHRTYSEHESGKEKSKPNKEVERHEPEEAYKTDCPSVREAEGGDHKKNQEDSTAVEQNDLGTTVEPVAAEQRKYGGEALMQRVMAALYYLWGSLCEKPRENSECQTLLTKQHVKECVKKSISAMQGQSLALACELLEIDLQKEKRLI